MSAHCADCGFDLPLEGDCTVCALQLRAERAEQALEQADELAIRVKHHADDPLANQCSYCDTAADDYFAARNPAPSPELPEQGGTEK